MVNIQRIEQNIAAFVDEDLAPKMPKLEGIAFSAFAPMYIRAKLPKLLALADGTGLVDGDNVDVERIFQEFKAKAAGKWPIEMAGFRFYEDDLDKLYRYIVR